MAEKNILVIEYNYIYAKMYKKQLGRKSSTVDIVESAGEAKRLIERQGKRYDVIITNLFSPPPDGLTFFSELADREMLPNTYVVLHELSKTQLDTFLNEQYPGSIRKQINDIVFIDKEATPPQAVMAKTTHA